MVNADWNIVDFSEGPISARLAAHADADIYADFNPRRGIRFTKEAHARIEATMKASLKSSADPKASETASASIAASIGTSQRSAFAAQYGVNGLWAEACASAEARARISGDLVVTGAMLADALRNDTELASAELVPALALLDAIELHASVFAEVYFAFRARARLMVYGSVIPQEGTEEKAGLVFKFDYGYAYFWGAGVSGQLGFELPDAGRVLTVVANVVVDEAVRLLPSYTAPEVRSLLRMVVPLAASAGVAAGKALGPPQEKEPGPGPVDGNPVDAVLRELRTTGLTSALTALLEMGMGRVQDLIGRALDPIALPPDVRDSVRAALQDGKGFLEALDAATSVPEALVPIAGLCDRFAQFSDAATPHLEGLDTVTDSLTVTVAAAGLLQVVLGHDPLPGFPSASAQRIVARVGGGTRALQLADLPTYLAADVGLIGSSPLASVDWLADVMDCAGPDLIKVLWELGDNAGGLDGRRALVTKLVHALIGEVGDRLRPFIDDLPEDSEMRPVAAFIEPLLEVIEVALVPALAATDKKAAARARDKLDTLLTGLFGAIVLRCMDHVIRPFFLRGKDQLNELADQVETHRDDPVFAEWFRLANDFGVVFRITPRIVIEGLREAANIVKLADGTAFESAVKLTRAFVLLPAESQERRDRLQKLAEGDEPPIGNERLVTDVLEALFVDSTGFALGIVPSSIKMTTLISLEQGPVSLEVLYDDAKAIVQATGKAIAAVVAVGANVEGILESLFADGEVTAEQLRELGDSLRNLIDAADDVADAVLESVKHFAWPLFLISTGGLGFALRGLFDEFFDKADWVREMIHDELVALSDITIEAMIAVAQDVGVLDAGEDEDLGSLGATVRQTALGREGQTGIDVGVADGNASVSHAELATMAANAAFGKAEVRDHIRGMHTAATRQADTARQATMIRGAGDQVNKVETALRDSLTARQRPTGTPMTIEVTGLNNEGSYHSGAEFDVVVTGAGTGFVTGAQPQVKVEVGGWPVQIDPAAWWSDDEGHLHGQFTLIADAALDAPHPFVGEGRIPIPPQATSLRTDAPGVQLTRTSHTQAFHAVLDRQAAAPAAVADPVRFLAAPLDPAAPSPAQTLTPESFLPPVLHRANPTTRRRFPAVLVLDRQSMIRASNNPDLIADLESLPGTPETAFISSNELATLGQDGTTSLVGGTPSETGTRQTALGLVQSMVAAGATIAPSRYPIRVAAAARPGCVVVTASVHALPTPEQEAAGTTPKASLIPGPVWFALQPGPAPHDAAKCQSLAGVPTTMDPHSTATVTVKMLNSGNTTWTTADGYKLGKLETLSGTTVGFGSEFVALPVATVAPQDSVTFRFEITAPDAGAAAVMWRMVRETRNPALRKWFGDTTPQQNLQVSTPILSDGAKVSITSTLPPMSPGSTRSVTVKAENTGTSRWTVGTYHLVTSGVTTSPPSALTKDVPHGGSVDFTFTLTAPSSLGERALECQMANGTQRFGNAASATITTVSIPQVEVPDVYHAEKTAAAVAIQNAGLVARFKSTGLRGDTWVSIQEPLAGTQVSKGSTVTCTLQKVSPPPP